MTPRAKRRKPIVIEAAGVRIRIYQRRGVWWYDVRHGTTRAQKSLRTAERSTAETRARAIAEAIARQQLLGETPNTVTLGQVFALYQRHKGETLEGQWKTAVERRQRAFLAAWGSAMPIAAISQTSVDDYCAARRRAYAVPRKADVEGAPPRVLRDGALDPDFRWLTSLFNWAVRHRLPDGTDLLLKNPLKRCKWPKEKNLRRPVASHDRYLKTMEHADTVDPLGRLRAIVALARHTGRRESAILKLRAGDVLLSKEQVALALAGSGMDERRAKHMPHGAIRWSAENDKMGIEHITPLNSYGAAELQIYMAKHRRVGDVPLFPSVDDANLPLARSVATKWLARVEQLAQLPKLVGGLYHPYRRLWASERKHLSNVVVAEAGGWKSTKTLAIYQQSDPASEYAAIANEG